MCNIQCWSMVFIIFGRTWASKKVKSKTRMLSRNSHCSDRIVVSLEPSISGVVVAVASLRGPRTLPPLFFFTAPHYIRFKPSVFHSESADDGDQSIYRRVVDQLGDLRRFHRALTWSATAAAGGDGEDLKTFQCKQKGILTVSTRKRSIPSAGATRDLIVDALRLRPPIHRSST